MTEALWSYSVERVMTANTLGLLNKAGVWEENLSCTPSTLTYVSYAGWFTAVVEATPNEADSAWDCRVWVTEHSATDIESALLTGHMMMLEEPCFRKKLTVETFRYHTVTLGDTGDIETVLWGMRDVTTEAAFNYETELLRQHVPGFSIERIHHPAWSGDGFNLWGEWNGFSVYMTYEDNGDAHLSVTEAKGENGASLEAKAEVLDSRIVVSSHSYDTTSPGYYIDTQKNQTSYSLEKLQSLYSVDSGVRFFPRGAFPGGIRTTLTGVEVLILFTVLAKNMKLTRAGKEHMAVAGGQKFLPDFIVKVPRKG